MRPRGNILGVGAHAVDLAGAVKILTDWVAEEQVRRVCLVPAHSVMDARDDPGFRRILNASDLVAPDGMAIVWLLRAQGLPAGRVYGPDLLRAACETGVALGWRHYFYGGGPGVSDALAARLVAEFPGLQVAGTASPPFGELSKEEEEPYLEAIRDARPDIVWVGLGAPKQERWIATHARALGRGVFVGVGAAFDFLSGGKPQAPRVLQRLGLEWLFRLVSEPRRLWRRYRRYPHFVALAAGQLCGLANFPLENME